MMRSSPVFVVAIMAMALYFRGANYVVGFYKSQMDGGMEKVVAVNSNTGEYMFEMSWEWFWDHLTVEQQQSHPNLPEADKYALWKLKMAEFQDARRNHTQTYSHQAAASKTAKNESANNENKLTTSAVSVPEKASPEEGWMTETSVLEPESQESVAPQINGPEPLKSTVIEQWKPNVTAETEEGVHIAEVTPDDTIDENDSAEAEQPGIVDNTNEEADTDELVCENSGTYCAAPLPKGRWVTRGVNDTFNAPICCSWDGGKTTKDRTYIQQCGNKGWPKRQSRWGQNTAQRYQGPSTTDYPAQSGGHGCDCSSYFEEKYMWSFEDPKYEKFSASRACHLLGNRTVLVLGDSTAQQSGSVLMNSLHAAGCAPQIRMSQSDFIAAELEGHHDNRGFYWLDEYHRFKPDILLWSVGNHIMAPEGGGDTIFDGLFEQIVANMTELQRQQQSANKPITRVIYRTQFQAGCEEAPILDYPPDEVAKGLSTADSAQDYNYNKKYRRDMFALSYLKSLFAGDTLKNYWQVMDLRMLYNRPDAHIYSQNPDRKAKKDCTHMCMPGPLDVVADIFQNLLAEQE